MNLNLTLDFEALLKEAQKRHKAYTDDVDQYRHFYIVDPNDPSRMGFPKDIKEKITAAYEKWTDWCEENIISNGLTLHTNIMGSPIGISALLVGRVN